jgi:hypothetical protein
VGNDDDEGDSATISTNISLKPKAKNVTYTTHIFKVEKSGTAISINISLKQKGCYNMKWVQT